MNRSNASASMDTKHVVLDVIVQMIAIAITVLLFRDRISSGQGQSIFALFEVFLIIFLLSNRVANVYNVTLFYYLDRILRKEAWSFVMASLVSAMVYFLCLNQSISQVFVVAFLAISFVLMVLEILVFRNLIDRIVSRKYVPRCVYVGSKDSYNKFRYFMQKTTMLVNEIGYVSYDDYDEGLEYIGSISQLESIIRRYNIDQVYIMQKRERDIADIQKYVDLCIRMGVTCRVIVDIYRRRKSYSYNSSIGTYPVITYHTICMNNWEAFFKRLFDIVFSIIAIILTSPIMLVTAIAINEGALTPGGTVTINLAVTNKSTSIEAADAVLTMKSESGFVYPVYGDDNQIMLGTIKPGETINTSIQLNVSKYFRDEVVAVGCDFTYFVNGEVANSQLMLAIPSTTGYSLNISSVKVAEKAFVGAKSLINFKITNISASEIMDAELLVSGNVEEESKTIKLGKITSNKQYLKDYYVAFTESGQQTITLILNYTDSNGEYISIDQGSYTVNVEPAKDSSYSVTKKTSPIVIVGYSLAGVACLAVLVIVILYIKKHI